MAENKKFYKNQKVKINNPISYLRNGEIATVKWTPGYCSEYVTVVFSDGRSGKYRKDKLIVI